MQSTFISDSQNSQNNQITAQIKNNIKNFKSFDTKSLIVFIDETEDSDVEALIVIGLTLKHLNKPKLVERVLAKCETFINLKKLSSEWKNAYDELKFWQKQTSAGASIMIQNHLKNKELEITLIVACMDRQDDLLKTLPSWFNIPQIKDFIIIDFSSTIPLSQNSIIKEWIKTKKITLLRVENETYFNLGKAYNLGVDFAATDKILKIDCDHLCLDPSWLDRLDKAKYDSHECYFIRGDWRFGHSLSGILFCDKRDFVYYREDLNGWGFDDLDLSKRIIETKPRIKEVIWPDASLYIQHLDHDDLKRTKNYSIPNKTQTNFNNRLICHQPLIQPNRTLYQTKWQNGEIVINYKPKYKLSEIYCVTLKDKTDRWNNFKQVLSNAHKFEAIDTRNNPEKCVEFGLSVNPSSLTYAIYFAGAHGAVGCYLSHYLIWQEIVNKKLPYVLIAEDDADPKSISFLLENLPINIDSYEFIQLNKRFSYIKPENRLMFHGTESYIVSYEGAKKLLKATNQPHYLEYVYHNEPAAVKAVAKRRQIKQIYRVYEQNSIIAPADKFISMCCDPKCDSEVRLNYLNYPCIDIIPEYAQSDIDSNMGHIWKMTEEQIEAQITKNEKALKLLQY